MDTQTAFPKNSRVITPEDGIGGRAIGRVTGYWQTKTEPWVMVAFENGEGEVYPPEVLKLAPSEEGE